MIICEHLIGRADELKAESVKMCPKGSFTDTGIELSKCHACEFEKNCEAFQMRYEAMELFVRGLMKPHLDG